MLQNLVICYTGTLTGAPQHITGQALVCVNIGKGEIVYVVTVSIIVIYTELNYG